MRLLAIALAVFALACSGAPASEAGLAAAPADVGAPTLAVAPTVLTIDETLDSADIAAAEQVAAEWCSFEPSLCLPVTVGPVYDGQPASIRRIDQGCPELGHTTAPLGQVQLFVACNDRQYHLTHGMVLSHELGHFWGALHIGPNNTMGPDARKLSRCITYGDLAEVCSHHDCQAPRFDLVCSDAEAVASNPYSAFESP